MSRMVYSDQQLIGRVESHAEGFDGWLPGVYDIWVRRKDALGEGDLFNDKVYTFSVAGDGKPEFRMVCSGTSHTGLWALKNFASYCPDGAAVLKSDQFVRHSHLPGLHKGYAAYRQAKPFPYYRDKDLDNLAEESGQLYQDVILANCHRAAAQGESQRVWNWSAGCLVRNKANQWAGWLAYMAKRPLSVAVLKEF